MAFTAGTLKFDRASKSCETPNGSALFDHYKGRLSAESLEVFRGCEQSLQEMNGGSGSLKTKDSMLSARAAAAAAPVRAEKERKRERPKFTEDGARQKPRPASAWDHN
jgi:hypothetical protein